MDFFETQDLSCPNIHLQKLCSTYAVQIFCLPMRLYGPVSDYASPGFARLRYMAPLEVLAFFAILAILATFWRFFWPILILGQFVITPYSNIF